MGSNRIVVRIFLAAALFAIVFVVLPRVANAQCDPATGGCSPTGGGGAEKVRRKTPTPDFLLAPALKYSGSGSGDPVPTSIFTALAGTLTAEAPPPAPNRPIVTPVAGPVFLLPGTTVMIIIVALIALAILGVVLLPRLLGKTKPPNPN